MFKRTFLAVASLLAACGAVWAVAAAQSGDPVASGAKAQAEKPGAGGAANAKQAAPAEAEASSKALASFEGGAVTVADLEEAIARQSPFMRKRYQDPKALEGLLDKTLRFALLAQEAERQGFGERDAVQQAVKQNAVQQLMRTEFDEKMSAETIPEADVKAYYEEHLDEYVRPATRRASHIMVATLEEAKALQTELENADLRAFRKLAREKSIDDATKMRGGDLRYFDSEGRLRGDDDPSIPGAIAKAAFGLENTGDTGKPIKVEGGYSVVMLTGQRPAMNRKLTDEDVQQSIRVRLWRERRQGAIEEFVAELHKRYAPEVHPELLGAIKLETDSARAKGPGIPKGFPERKPGETPTANQSEGAGKADPAPQ